MKTIVQLYPSMPVANSDERARLRPIGRNVELYQETLRGLVDIARAADSLGYWGLSFVEHHLHSEGFEVGPVPGILNAWLSSSTTNLRLGQLGYVMSTHDPIRVAEETAVLDHILQGRFFVGFSRGYQSRWIRTLGQQFDARATLLQRETEERAKDDQRNQRIFRECVEIVRKAWTEESFSHDGEFYRVPNPASGIEGYSGVNAASRFGAPREVSDGKIAEISVVPAPYQRPHPPVFVNSSGSPTSAHWAGEQGFTACYLAPLEHARVQEAAYREGAARAGRTLHPGESQGIWRFVVVGKTEEDAIRKAQQSILPMIFDFYQDFFPLELFTGGGAVGPSPIEAALASGMIIAGTPDSVRAQIGRLHDEIPFEYFVLISHYALEPLEDVLEDLDLFASEVLTDFVST